MEEEKVSENHLTSAAAFVEGGIQDACDDACSICLEDFCDSDPSTLTTCNHEFHLQCILEWCQRSSQCPMCLQNISLKDPSSQELLDTVEHERNMRMNSITNTSTIFHHPTLGDFELQHLPDSGTESELEERIIQHLAAAAAMGRARQLARRESQRNRSSTQSRPRFLVVSTHPNGSSATPDGSSPPPSVTIAAPNSPFIAIGEDSQDGTSSTTNRSPTQTTTPGSQDTAGPSDFQTFSESVKSRLSSLSMRYKESITKSTRGWKERLFARNSSITDPNTEASRQIDQAINMSGEEEENAAELKIPDEFLKAKCLMNCEVALILEHKYEQLQQMSDDPMNQMSQVFEKSLQYVKRFSRYKNPDAVRQVRETMTSNLYKLRTVQLCVLGNLCPETVEEGIAMVPSIKTRGRAHDDEAIEKMLNDLSLIKKFE
ncbi:hypothetical protein RD792_009930 [Penstemon davidsonii]|uniref:RING-type domain-containing protein n=1 Tax=Penstemon davidsonii TaxID=160366 RepID=A0ABR0D0M4_9LAMI|nr:hypothetical protein RD792_009930 [Penstemon davidsonii]